MSLEGDLSGDNGHVSQCMESGAYFKCNEHIGGYEQRSKVIQLNFPNYQMLFRH